MRSKGVWKTKSSWFCFNLTLILFFSPQLPTVGGSSDWPKLKDVASRFSHPYLDPYFESFQTDSQRPTPDNGQSEYLLVVASMSVDPPLKAMSTKFVKKYFSEISGQKYDALILVEGVYFHTYAMQQINASYELVSSYKVRPYYYTFKVPVFFGAYDAQVRVYLPKRNIGHTLPRSEVDPPPRVKVER